MDYLPEFLRSFDLDLRPSNSEQIDVTSARERLYPGAHIATSNPYEHYHHGIVVDTEPEDLLIVHFWGREKDQGRIQTTTLPIFLAGGIHNLGVKTRQLYLINYENDTEEKRRATVGIAKEMLEKADEVTYDIATRNCESFARFCRTNQWESEQIQKIRDTFVANAREIYEMIQDADETNRQHVSNVLKTVPEGAMTSSEKALYDAYCHCPMTSEST